VTSSRRAPPSPAATGVPADAAGVAHPRAHGDARIVSLVPSITELLFALGLGTRVVGRTTFCVHPAREVAAIARVGGTKKVRMDRLRELAPTHVIVNVDENTREAADEIAGFVPHVVVTHPLAPLDNLSLYRLLGAIFGREADAERLCGEFRAAHERLAAAARRWPERRVLYLIWRDPWMTVSPDTYVSRTLALAGWRTVPEAPAARYPEVALDRPLLDGTDLVLLSSEPFPFREKHRPEVERLVAGRAPVAFIDGEMTSWYGSRAIAGLGYLERYVGEILAR